MAALRPLFWTWEIRHGVRAMVCPFGAEGSDFSEGDQTGVLLPERFVARTACRAICPFGVPPDVQQDLFPEPGL